MKRKLYKVEAIQYGFIGLVVMSFVGVIYTVRDIVLIGNKSNLSGLLFTLVFMLLFMGFFVFACLRGNKKKQEFIKRRNTIMECGTMVRGKVADTKYDLVGERKSRHARFFAKVVFWYNGENREYWKPELNFNAVDLCASGDIEADVYVYNDEYYVDNFTIEGFVSKKDENSLFAKLMMIISFCLTIVPAFFLIVYKGTHGDVSNYEFMRIIVAAGVAFIACVIAAIVWQNKGR